jgi:serine protease Do
MRLHPSARLRRTLTLITALALLPGFARAQNPRHTPEVEVVKRVRAAVVNIHSERTVRGNTGEEQLFTHAPLQNRINGMGTGIVIDARGYIVTCQHVVEDVNIIRVRLVDRTEYTARVVARDVESDLALLKVDANRPLTPIPLGTATDVMVGEKVIAIGNAYGYEYTVSTGIVSALKRDVNLNKEVQYKSLIQTDAAINPGNSGGPLMNINGEMIGMNVAIRAGAQGISFAIPVETMIRVTSTMLSRKRGGVWHGLVVRDEVQSPEDDGILKTEAGTPTYLVQRSLRVDKVEPNSPAATTTIKPGDVITQIGDTRITCSLDLERALIDHAAGEKLAVSFRREGTERAAEIALQALDLPSPTQIDVVWRKLGVKLNPVKGDLVSRTNRQLHGGLSVSEVRADSAAGKAGIQRGDVLIGLHQWETVSLDNVVFVLTHRDLPTFNPLTFYIVRSGQVHRWWFQQVE